MSKILWESHGVTQGKPRFPQYFIINIYRITSNSETRGTGILCDSKQVNARYLGRSGDRARRPCIARTGPYDYVWWAPQYI